MDTVKLYVVQKGDSVTGIAGKHNMSVPEFSALNDGIVDETLVQGMKVRVSADVQPLKVQRSEKVKQQAPSPAALAPVAKAPEVQAPQAAEIKQPPQKPVAQENAGEYNTIFYPTTNAYQSNPGVPNTAQPYGGMTYNPAVAGQQWPSPGYMPAPPVHQPQTTNPYPGYPATFPSQTGAAASPVYPANSVKANHPGFYAPAGSAPMQPVHNYFPPAPVYPNPYAPYGPAAQMMPAPYPSVNPNQIAAAQVNPAVNPNQIAAAHLNPSVNPNQIAAAQVNPSANPNQIAAAQVNPAANPNLAATGSVSNPALNPVPAVQASQKLPKKPDKKIEAAAASVKQQNYPFLPSGSIKMNQPAVPSGGFQPVPPWSNPVTSPAVSGPANPANKAGMSGLSPASKKGTTMPASKIGGYPQPFMPAKQTGKPCGCGGTGPYSFPYSPFGPPPQIGYYGGNRPPEEISFSTLSPAVPPVYKPTGKGYPGNH
jgi:LysM domain.